MARKGVTETANVGDGLVFWVAAKVAASAMIVHGVFPLVNSDYMYKMHYIICVLNRRVLKCGLAHLNANARDGSNASANANAQQLNQMKVKLQMRSS